MSYSKNIPKNKSIFPNENIVVLPAPNPVNTSPQTVNNPTAILCKNNKIRNTKKKRLTSHFLKLLQNLHEIAKKEGLRVVPFSAHITAAGLHALNAECERRNESLATVIHQRYSKALQYRINRKPVFFFAMGFDNPNKPAAKGRTRTQPKCYTGIHTHGFILVNENEHNGRTNEGQAIREAFKTFNGKYGSESFKQQEVSITTKTKIEYWETKYTAEFSMQKQAEYLAKNALQFDRYHQKDEKPYATSKIISGYGKDREQAATNKVRAMFKDFDAPPKPPEKQTLTGGASQTPSPLVLTESGLQKPPPQSESLKQKIVEWREQLQQDESYGKYAIPIANNDKTIDEMLDEL